MTTEERPLCPTCGAYWKCEHPFMFLFGIPVFIDETQEENVRLEHTGPPPEEFIERATQALDYLRPVW